MTEDKKTKGEKALEVFDGYFVENTVNDFSEIPIHTKLTMLQKLPRGFIKTRPVAGKQMPYIPHDIAEKCLNFVFNFDVSNEVISQEYIAGKKSSKGVPSIVAEVQMKFTFNKGKDNEIIRTVYSSHTGYESLATNRGDIMKSAFSKSFTVVARTFGIGSNLAERENKFYRDVNKKEATAKKEEAKIDHIKKLTEYLTKNGYKTDIQMQDQIYRKAKEIVKMSTIKQAQAQDILFKLLNE